MLTNYYKNLTLIKRTKVSDNAGSYYYNETTHTISGYINKLSYNDRLTAMQLGIDKSAHLYTQAEVNVDDIIKDDYDSFVVIGKINLDNRIENQYYILKDNNINWDKKWL